MTCCPTCLTPLQSVARDHLDAHAHALVCRSTAERQYVADLREWVRGYERTALELEVPA